VSTTFLHQASQSGAWNVMKTSLPSTPGVSAQGLPDAEWTTEHPQWVPATVWAAHAAYEQSHTQQQDDTSRVQSKCAACTAHIPDLQANTRCSKCKKVLSAQV